MSKAKSITAVKVSKPVSTGAKDAKKASAGVTVAKTASENTRQISTEEYQFALSIFQREFPPRDEIYISNQTGLQNRNYVRPTIDGNIRMYMGNLFDSLLSNLTNKSLFAHELTHAWQIEHYGLLWYGKEALLNQVIDTSSYDYVCSVAKTIGDYNAEQQGEIVRNYVLGKDCERNLVEKTLFSKTWKLLIGSDARDVAVDSDGTYYMVNKVGIIYKYNGNDWEKLNGSDGLAISANGGQVFLVNTAGYIYQRVNNSWKKLPGSDAVDIAVATDGNVFMVNSHGKIYNYHSSVGWQQMAGSDGSRIATGHGEIWMVNTVGKIYRMAGAGWVQMSGSSGRDIVVTNDGKVFLTNSVGKIYQRTGDNWTQLDGSDGLTIAANSNTVVLVNTKGRMYFRKIVVGKTAPVISRPVSLALK